MTEVIIADGVRASDLELDYVPDFSGSLDVFRLEDICRRLIWVLSDHFHLRMRAEKGEEALSHVVVFTTDIRNPENGQPEKWAYKIDFTNLGLNNQPIEVIRAKNSLKSLECLRQEFRANYRGHLPLRLQKAVEDLVQPQQK